MSIFSVVNAVLLRPLPWADSDRIVFVYETWKEFRQGNASVGHFHDWTEQGEVFEDTAALTRATYNLSDGEPERVSGAYFVTQRTPEIGLRLALGATPRAVLLMVVRHGAALAGTGIAIGLIAALGATRVLATLLFEITPTDPPTYAMGGVALSAIALLACAVPALRAVRVSPMQSLAEP